MRGNKTNQFDHQNENHHRDSQKPPTAPNEKQHTGNVHKVMKSELFKFLENFQLFRRNTFQEGEKEKKNKHYKTKVKYHPSRQ